MCLCILLTLVLESLGPETSVADQQPKRKQASAWVWDSGAVTWKEMASELPWSNVSSALEVSDAQSIVDPHSLHVSKLDHHSALIESFRLPAACSFLYRHSLAAVNT